MAGRQEVELLHNVVFNQVLMERFIERLDLTSSNGNTHTEI